MVRNPHFTGEIDAILWFSGMTTISIVNLKDLSTSDIKNFLPDNPKQTHPMAFRGIMKDGGKFILIFFVIDGQACFAFLSEGSPEPEILFVEDVLRNCSRPSPQITFWLVWSSRWTGTSFSAAAAPSQTLRPSGRPR
jgi:hypothetical protein